MSAGPNKTLTRGPLPPGVYWRRRVVLFVGAAVLVFVIAQVLGGGSDGKSGGDPTARQAGAEVTTSATDSPSVTSSTSVSASSSSTAASTATGSTATSPTAPITLADPSGPCDPSDIQVTPQVSKAVAGSDVTIRFALQTKTTEACTWSMNRHDLAVKIARKHKVLWSSTQCPDQLPQRSVVVRKVVPSLVSMVWNARFSTDDCGRSAPFVHQGNLTVWASALGGEPAHSDFDLTLPDAPTIQVTPRANPSATGSTQPRR